MNVLRALAFLTFLLPGLLAGQDTFRITRSTLAGGGELRTGSGPFGLSGTTGQPGAAPLPNTAGAFSLTEGFWAFSTTAGSEGDARLTGLTVSAGTLLPPFASSLNDYSMTVGYDVTGLILTPVKASPGGSIRVRVNFGDYSTVASGTPSIPLPLNTGINGVQILVTSRDAGTTRLYNLTVTRSTSPNLGVPDSLDAAVVGSRVMATAVQPDGRILLAGGFSQVAGTARTNIARLQAGGALDTAFAPEVNGQVFTMAVQDDGRIVIGGIFTSAGGEARSRLARLHGDGSVDDDFDPDVNDFVVAAALQPDGKLVIGGAFTAVQGTPRARLARLHADGTLDASFAPEVGGQVNCLAIQADGKIVLGGLFTAVNGQTRNRIARLHADGTLDTTFTGNLNGSVSVLALHGSRIYAGGSFTQAGGGNVRNLTRLNTGGTPDFAFTPDPDGVVQSIAIQADGSLVIGGSFTTVGGLARNHLARVRADGLMDEQFNPDADSTVFGLALQADGKILAGGFFSAIGGVPRQLFARLDNDASLTSLDRISAGQINWTRGGTAPDVSSVRFEQSTDSGATWSDLGPPARAGNSSTWTLSGLALPETVRLRARGRTAGGYVNGSSGMVAQVADFISASNAELAALVAAQASLQPFFSPEQTSYTATVPFAVAVLNLTPVKRSAGGSIQMRVNGGSYLPILTGTAGALPLRVGVNLVETLVTAADGSGTRVYTLTVTRLPEIPPGSPDALSAAVTGSRVLATAVQPDGRIILAGDFSAVQGAPRSRIARLHADGTLDTAFNPGADGTVNCIAVQADGAILFGGAFTSLGGRPRHHLARVNAGGAVDATFDPDCNGEVLSLAVQADGAIVAGGGFTSVGGNVRPFLVRLNGAGATDAGFAPSPDGPVHGMAALSDGRIWISGLFGTVGGFTRFGLARLHADGSLDFDTGPAPNGLVSCMAVQADGKILLGGQFTAVTGQPRQRIARLMPSGAVDGGFNPGADGAVFCLAVQANGGILAGGAFTQIGGRPRDYIARVHASGITDEAFNPDCDGYPYSIAQQADGKVLAGGDFSTIGGVPRARFARLANDPAVQSLGFPDNSSVWWARGGALPELSSVRFQHSGDGGASWTDLGSAVRLGNTSDWLLAGIAGLPLSGRVRALGRTTGGFQSGSAGLISQEVSLPSAGGYALWAAGSIPVGGNTSFTGDWDGDGVANGIAYVFGSAAFTFGSAGGFLTPAAIPGDVDLVFERSDSLAEARWDPLVSWLNGAPLVTANGGVLVGSTIHDTLTFPRAFYRYRAVLRP